MNEEKIHNDELYLPFDESIVEEQTKCLEKSKHEYLLENMFAEIGEGCYI